MADPLFTDRALQETYQRLIRSAGAEHIDAVTWDGIAAGDLDQDARDRAFDHIVECGECSRVWKGILELRKEAEAQGLSAPAPPRATASWQTKYIPLAVAATLIIGVAGAMLMRQPAGDANAVRSATQLPAIEGAMAANDAEGVPSFVWAPVAGATRYHVEIFSEDGRSLWSGETASAPLRWPAALPRTAGAYRWRVDAIGSDGVVARSRLTLLQIR